MADFSYISLNIDDNNIAWLALNRPDVHNAFDDRMISEIRQGMAELSERGDIRAMVLHSNARHFSAGADLNWMRSMAEKNYQENVDDAGELGALMWELDQLPMPTIALVNGAAFGGAVGLVACCDIAIASERASFCLSEVKIGLIPAVISPYVVRAMGHQAARRYMLTAERFKADQALRFGLVDEVTESDLQEAVQPIIEAILQSGPNAIKAAKDLIHHVSNHPLNPELVDETARCIAEIRVSNEGQEGLRAFLDKRTAGWVKTNAD